MRRDVVDMWSPWKTAPEPAYLKDGSAVLLAACALVFIATVLAGIAFLLLGNVGA